MELTDVNYDCLERIFSFMSLKDLLNVCLTNKQMCCVGISLIIRKYRVLNLRIDASEFQLNGYNPFQVKDDTINVTKYKSALILLRILGMFFTKVSINYCFLPLKQRKKIEYHLGKYCSRPFVRLNTIKLENCPKGALQSIQTPLRTVMNVIITGDSHFDFNELNTKTPNMISLKLTWLQVADARCIEHSFPSLKCIEVDVRDRIQCFTEYNIQNVIKLNPQLYIAIIQLHRHRDLNGDALIQFLETNFESPGSVAFVLPPVF